MSNLFISKVVIPVTVTKIDEPLIIPESVFNSLIGVGSVSTLGFFASLPVGCTMFGLVSLPLITAPCLLGAIVGLGGGFTCNIIDYCATSDKHHKMFLHTLYKHPYSIQYNIEKREKNISKYPQSIIDNKIVEVIKKNADYIIDEAEQLSDDKNQFEIEFDIDAKLEEDYYGKAIVVFDSEDVKQISKL